MEGCTKLNLGLCSREKSAFFHEFNNRMPGPGSKMIKRFVQILLMCECMYAWINVVTEGDTKLQIV